MAVPTAAPAVPQSPSGDSLSAWPRSAQVALAVLILVASVLIGVLAYQSSRGSTRPAELERGAPPLDLNEADRVQLAQLPDIGDKLAERIDEYRRVNGAFRNVDELTQVPGIGPSRMARLRDRVFVVAEEDDEAPMPKAGTGRKASLLTESIDLNLASLEQLQRLPNIGQVRAQAIFDARRLRPFESVDDLRTRKVRGIGPKVLEGIRPYVFVKPRRET